MYFKVIKSFEKKVWLATPTPHSKMMEFIQKVYNDNRMAIACENLTVVEEIAVKGSKTE